MGLFGRRAPRDVSGIPPPVPPGAGLASSWSPARRLTWAERRAAARARRRLHEERVRSARARLDEAYRDLELLDRSARDTEVARYELIDRWKAWDKEEDDRIHAQVLESFRLLYPDASDGRLEELVESFTRRRG